VFKAIDFEERKLMEFLNNQGKSLTEISSILKRDQSTIGREFKRSGGRKNYCAIEAEKSAKQRYNMQFTNLRTGETQSKMDSLIMLIEILTEEIKSIKERILALEGK
jgi:IS30 family transposase